MPRFTKYVFGGVVGAGLALLFAPRTGRDMRRMLMGGGRPALPPPQPAAAPAPERTAPVREVSLESRIEETRRQVESQLAPAAPEIAVAAPEGPAAAAPEAPAPPVPFEGVVEAELIEEDFIVEEAPVEPAPEPEVKAAPEAEPEAGFPSEEAETRLAEEELAAAQAEAAAAEEASRLLEAEAEAEPEAGSQFAGGQTLAELAQEHDQMQAGVEAEAAQERERLQAEAGDEFAALRTPAEGEPTMEPAAAAEEPGEPERPQPSRLDHEEMRRRINETRDRLKAKAFDALVSGETFIETEADKDKMHDQPTGPRLAEDVEKQIDQSLKEDL